MKFTYTETTTIPGGTSTIITPFGNKELTTPDNITTVHKTIDSDDPNFTGLFGGSGNVHLTADQLAVQYTIKELLAALNIAETK